LALILISRWITSWGHGTFRPPGYLTSDRWLFDGRVHVVESIAKQMRDGLTVLCASSAVGNSLLAMPYTVNANRRSSAPNRRGGRQHHHVVLTPGLPASSRHLSCRVTNTARNFTELPHDIRRRLWQIYRQDDSINKIFIARSGHLFNPLQWRV
jgi:hypothetical protein